MLVIACLTSAIVFIGWVYNMQCTPSSGLGMLIFNSFWALALISYLRSACTDPGTSATRPWKNWENCYAAQQRGGSGTGRNGAHVDEETYCEKCEMARPLRSHHCSVCATCILRKDHHCPWIGNCIGMRNHKFFILTLFYGFLAAAAFVGTLRQPHVLQAVGVLMEMESIPRSPEDTWKAWVLAWFVPPYSVIAASMFAVAFGLACLLMLPQMIWGLYMNVTGAECATGMSGCPGDPSVYDKNNIKLNLEDVFGANSMQLSSLLPTTPIGLDDSMDMLGGTCRQSLASARQRRSGGKKKQLKPGPQDAAQQATTTLQQKNYGAVV